MILRALKSTRRTLQSEDGVVLIELVIWLTFLALLNIGWSYAGLVADAKNAVTRTAYSAASMAALEPSITDGQMTALMTAATSMLSTYAAAPEIVISNVAVVPGTNQWIVVWSDANSAGVPRAIGSEFTFSGAYGDATTSRVVAEVRMTFRTPLSAMLRSVGGALMNVPDSLTMADTSINTPLMQSGNVARILSSGVTLR